MEQGNPRGRLREALVGDMCFCPFCAAPANPFVARCKSCGSRIVERKCIFSFVLESLAWLVLLAVATITVIYSLVEQERISMGVLATAYFALPLGIVAVALSFLGKSALEADPGLYGKKMADNGRALGAGIIFLFAIPLLMLIGATIAQRG